MKKFLCVVIALMLLAFTACGKTETNVPTPTPETEPTATAE